MRRLISILLLALPLSGGAQAQTTRSATSYFNRAMQLYAQGNFDRAISDLDTVRFERGYINIANIAIADYNNAIRINPRCAYSYNGRGNARLEKRDVGGAVGDYNKAQFLLER